MSSFSMRRAFPGCVALLIAGLIGMLDVGQTQVLASPETYGKPGRLGMKKIGFDNLSGWKSDDHRAAFKAFRRSCDAIVRKSPTVPRKSTALLRGGLPESVSEWH